MKFNFLFFLSKYFLQKKCSLIIDGLLLHQERPFWVNRQSEINKTFAIDCCLEASRCVYLRACEERDDTTLNCTTILYTCRRLLYNCYILIWFKILSHWFCTDLLLWVKHIVEMNTTAYTLSRTLEYYKDNKVHNLEISYRHVKGNNHWTF